MKRRHEDLQGAYDAFRKDAAQLEATQTQVLQFILEGARDSAVTKRYGLDKVKTLDEYRRAVPVIEYEAMAADVEKMMAGERGLLIDDPALCYVQTSGTSSASKWVPVRALREKEHAFTQIDEDTIVYYFLREHPDFSYDGQYLTDDPGGLWMYLAGRPPAADREGGPKKGFISGMFYSRFFQNGPECFFVQPEWLTKLDPASKLYALPRLAIGQDIRAVSGLPDAVTEMTRYLDSEKERFIKDVRDGTISIDNKQALAVLPTRAPDPALAAQLEAAVKRDGTLSPTALWPRLRLLRSFFSAGLGVYADYYRKNYKVPQRESGYYSSEGHLMGFTRANESSAMGLCIHRQVYEFVDEDDNILLAHQLQEGRLYRLVLTTPHGLYRLDTKDLLRVVGFEHGAPLITLEGRVGSMSIVGEKMTVGHVNAAIAELISALSIDVVGFTFVPHVEVADGGRPFYELVLEISQAFTDADAIVKQVEASLGRANIWYSVYRLQEGSLAPLQVTFAQPGAFSRLRQRLAAEHGAQVKLPPLWKTARPSELPPYAERRGG